MGMQVIDLNAGLGGRIYAFNLHKIQICTKTINAPSKRVIEKCGFTYEGTLRDFFYMNGEYIGRLYYSMLKSEFEKNNSGLVK